MAALPSPFPALWPGFQMAEAAAMSPRGTQEFAEGTRVLPDTFRGLEGQVRDSGSRRWAPFGVRYASGTRVTSFYCHNYRQPTEHYHASREDMAECQKLYGGDA